MKRVAPKFFALAAIFLATEIFFAGCEKSATTPVSAPAPAGPGSVPTHAQEKLPTMKLWMGKEELIVEVATTEEQEQTGLMFRTNLDENAGMLFVFPMPQAAHFWMTNCPLPLSAAYIDPEGVIAEIHPLHANDPTSVDSASDNIQYVLEVKNGWFDRHHISVGTGMSAEYGSLHDTFFGQH